MRFSSALLVAALPALAAAIPLSARDNDKKYDSKHWDDSSKKHDIGSKLGGNVFDFTSTYVAYATPDQVIANNQTAAPGEEGASGVCESCSLPFDCKDVRL
jgi:hypothetical protein